MATVTIKPIRPQPEPATYLDREALAAAALAYLAGGLSIIPVNGRKKPSLKEWKPFQGKQATREQFERWVRFHSLAGFAVVCGEVSGGLAIFDFDVDGFIERFLEAVKRDPEVRELAGSLPIQQTGSGNHQIAFRCGLPLRNDKLAYFPADNKEGREIAIETRGEGGYAVLPPSFCHLAEKRGVKHKQAYKVLQGDFANIPTITDEQAQHLIEVARSLCQAPVSKKQMRSAPLSPKSNGGAVGGGVIGGFNESYDVGTILSRNGYQLRGNRFLAPDSTTGDPGVHIFLDTGRCYSHHSNDPLNDGYAHNPFSVFCILEHGGDVKAAVKAAAAELGLERTRGRPPQAVQEDKPKPTQAATKSFLPLPPAFPLDVFPPIYQQALREVQEAYAVPLEIPACALLSECGTCIGRTRGVLIKSGWIEQGNLWLAIVGKSGIGKSPCVRKIFRPIFEVEKRMYAEYQEAQKQYQHELEQRQSWPRKERAQLGPPPPPPVWNQLFVDDATTEALTDALAANPRGILWNRDELSGLILDLDKYKGKDGGTKSRMMSSYDSGVWKVNRRDNSKKAFIPNATLSVFGTIQPRALPTIFSNRDAVIGFLPRFIFVNAVQETPPLWTDKTVSERAAQDLSHLVEGLLHFELDGEGAPQIIGVTREGQALYQAWYNDKVMAPWRDTEAEIYDAVLAKLRGQALRICLILHCTDAVANHKSEMAPVSADTMRKALRLADYFEIHQRNAWQTIITEGAAATLTPIQRQVVTAILNLESEIRGGLLPTARVTEEINRRGDERFALSTDTVGRVVASLGLKTRHIPGETVRGISVGSTDIEKFRNIFGTSGLSGLSGSNPDSAKVCGFNASGSQVVQVVRPDDERGHISQETMAAWDAVMSQVVEKAVRTIDVHTDDLLAGGEI
ncbi:MAG: DUF3987 domain-containing protein [Pseudomonadota bacterium]